MALRGNPLSLSTDGSRFAYAAATDGGTLLYLRTLDRLETRPVPGTRNAYSPFFSPDGTWLGYFDSHDSALKKVPVEGGDPVSLCPAHFGLGASWGPDNEIIFTPDVFSGLYRIPAKGGAPEPLTRLRGKETTHRWPHVLPDGRGVIFTMGTAGGAGALQAAAYSFKNGRTRVLLESASDARYVPSGHLLFLRGRDLMAVRFDSLRLEVLGPPFVVKKGISADKTVGAGHFSCSDTGTLVYALGDEDSELRSLVWTDSSGAVERLTVSRGAFTCPRLSPDEQRLAVVIQAMDDKSHIWVLELASGKFTRLTSEGDNIMPVWTPDGKRVTFASDRAGQWNLYWAPADAGGPAERLYDSPNPQFPNCWSSDGQSLIFTELAEHTGADICVLLMGSRREVSPFLRTPASEWGGAFSPDNRWIAYTADDSALSQVYLRPYPGPGEPIRVSTADGSEPVWSRDGRELYFRSWQGLMGAEIQREPEVAAGPPRQVVTGEIQTGDIPAFANFDVTREGPRFVLIPREQREKRQLFVDLNWPSGFDPGR